jgi:hypothetical protein
VYGTVTADLNVSDGTAGTGFTVPPSLPFVSDRFKPFADYGADKPLASLPSGYPAADFNGKAITAPAAAGAVQTIATGYILNREAAGPGWISVNADPNEDGLYTGNLTLTAKPDPGKELRRWTLNGAEAPLQPTLSLTMSGHKTVGAVFSASYTVTSAADSGPGSLRSALGSVLEGDYVVFQLPAGQKTIVLATPLPAITRSVIIEGNGAALTQSGFAQSSTSQLLNISSANAEVRISRLHFKGGRATDNGAAIYNAGKLFLESCVFSDNRTTNVSANGGAIYTGGSSASATISGCTFYGNIAGTTGGRGGAIYKGSGALTLAGNLFWGNSAASLSVLSTSGTTPVSNGFNISDKDGGTGGTASGWAFDTNDAKAAVLPLNPSGFNPLTGGAAHQIIGSTPAGYPTKDFNGDPIPANNASAGAVQTPVNATGFVLYYTAQGLGAVTRTAGTPDVNGLFSNGANVTFEAAPTAAANSAGVFSHWTINGTEQGPQTPANRLSFSISGHTIVEAVFTAAWTVTSSGNTGTGSLREALGKAQNGDRIVFQEGQTVTLTEPLPGIARSVIIEGNGATLTQSGFTAGASSQLLSVSVTTAKVRVSRLHFKGGRATTNGAAIYNAGELILESCIFSDNRTSAAGGALYTTGSAASLAISGCTFYGNAAGAASGNYGGAVYKASGALALTGNLFWENTAYSYSVLYTSGTPPVSGGFNISDKAGGTSTAASGWAFAAGDAQTTVLPFVPNTFRPFAALDAAGAVAARPADYPTEDFYGNDIPATGAAAGAVQTTVAGYVLDYAAQGPGTVSVTAGTVDNGVAAGSVTLTAAANAGREFRYWIVNGAAQPAQAKPAVLSLAMDGHKTVRAFFSATKTVTSTANAGAGSLRETLAIAEEGDYIVLPQGQTITLTAPLPQISMGLSIFGNGSTLTQTGFVPSNASQLLYVSSSTAEVRVNRLHFKGGRAENFGAAIRMTGGTLILESCIFSDNRTISNESATYGGAIFAGTSDLYSYGCTFYNNSTTGWSPSYSYGGAISGYSSNTNQTITLTGNLFWGNTAAVNSVVYTPAIAVVSSGGFNLSDKAGGTGAAQSGWTFAGDAQATALPLYYEDFKPLSNGAAYQGISSLPEGYPTEDFYGITLSAPASIGAVQTPTTSTGYVLDYAAQGPGTARVKSGTANPDGLFANGAAVTLEAKAANGGTFMHWTVDGVTQAAQTPPAELTVTMNDHKTVRAVFVTYWTVSSAASDGTGSLREALTKAEAGDHIVLQGQTITLTAILPTITKTLTIEGNGSTLTQTGFAASNDSQLLYINSATAEVRISRLHFKGGIAGPAGGAAIYNRVATLILESCIFSENTGIGATGGAVYISTGSATISGCTFYGNSAGTGNSIGGAVYTYTGGLYLRGNLFWGNTASRGSVVHGIGSVTSQGYNISDRPLNTSDTGSGWTPATGDVYTASLPLWVADGGFKLLPTGAAYQAIATRPADYPAKDFYGNDIPAVNASAGAVQATIATSGYVLDYAAQGPGTVAITSGTPDSYGFYSGSVTLEATPASGRSFIRWIVNGTVLETQTPANRLTIVMDSQKAVRAVFAAIHTVSSAGNAGAGTLREALANAGEGDYIALPAGQTITLTATLPEITKSLTIQGNGVTLTQSGIAAGAASQLLYISSSSAEVAISRLHFKGARTTDYGGAIRNTGKLTLESCIFSDNQTTAGFSGGGGAIYTAAGTTLAVSGCTFYGNANSSSYGDGGAIYREGSVPVTLTGNLFWGNTADSYSVVYGGYPYTTTSLGYNISDKPNGTGSAQSGWEFAIGANADKQATILPLWVTDGSFKPLSTGAAYQAIGTRPAGYPVVDFNGASIPAANASAGAVQTAIITTGYTLDYGAQGQGTVQVKSGTPDSYGFYSGNVTLEAVSSGGTFTYWTVNGTTQGTQTPANEIVIAMDGPKTVRAFFSGSWTVTDTGNSGPGTLRQAITDALSGDVIVLPANQTITLTATLPQITKSLTIQGNGATLTQSGIATSDASQLLYINSATAVVRVSRLHFKGGRAQRYGGAIRNVGILTLESCIFSDNQQTSSAQYGGGAIFTSGTTVTISGCTFYGNTAATQGGAIHKQNGTVTLTGNLFWGNTATNYSVSSGTVTSGGYNISDKPIGTGAANSGWTFATGDAQAAGLPLWTAAGFKPLSTGAAYQAIVTRPAGYPTTDFTGAAIPTANAMAGAVQAVITTTGYGLDHAAEGQGQVQVTSGTPDSYGFYSGSVTLTATSTGGSAFSHWTVNGTAQGTQSPPGQLTLTMDGHKTVRAIFITSWPVTDAASLSSALTSASDGDTISFPSGGTITLTAGLTITKSLTIQGNGATLTQTGLAISTNHQLLNISSNTTVRISRLHFTGGRSKDQGSAIYNAGNLTLESCILSDNITDYGSSYADGGAIYTSGGSLTVLGCTFTENTSAPNGRGGAIERASSGTLSLTGNMFVGNVGQYPVVYGGSVTTGGYNVSDVAGGTAAGESGWTFDSTDLSVTDITFDATFRPSSSATLSIPSLPSGFPTTYFDGTARGANSTPVAMPKK